MRRAMAEASRIVLSGFELRSDVRAVRWPDRYMDEKRGRRMWDTVMQLLPPRLAVVKAVGTSYPGNEDLVARVRTHLVSR